MRLMILCLMLFQFETHAEYRAFELVIADTTTGQERVVLSNLDPLQYPRYYPTKRGERISYRATWRCKGNTANFQPICPNPKAK